MTIDDQRKQQLDEMWLDSLLSEAFHANGQHESEQMKQMLVQLDESPRFATKSASMRWKTGGVFAALAASMLIIAFWLPWGTQSNQARAAIAHAMKSIPGNREYRITFKRFDAMREARLFLNVRNQFVVQHPSWFRNGTTWIGGSDQSRWIVPQLGPAIAGDQRLVGTWMTNKDSDSPLLHIRTVLERLSKHYELQFEGNVMLDPTVADVPVNCQHVSGRLKQATAGLPQRIELWARRDDGIAQRVELHWGDSNELPNASTWVFELVGTEPFPADWFSPDGHLHPGQIIVRANKSKDMEQMEQSRDEAR